MDSESCSSKAGTHRAFFTLQPTYATRYYWASVRLNSIQGEPLWHRDLVDFRGCMLLDVRRGKIAGDFVWNGLMVLVASNRVVDILERNRITGFRAFEVRLNVEDVCIRDYHGIAVAGTGGKNNPKAYRGGIISGTDIKRIHGPYPTQWDRSDMFTLNDIP